MCLEVRVGLLFHFGLQRAEAGRVGGLLERVELAVDIDDAVEQRVRVLRDDVVHLRGRLFDRRDVGNERRIGRLREVVEVLRPREDFLL